MDNLTCNQNGWNPTKLVRWVKLWLGNKDQAITTIHNSSIGWAHTVSSIPDVHACMTVGASKNQSWLISSLHFGCCKYWRSTMLKQVKRAYHVFSSWASVIVMHEQSHSAGNTVERWLRSTRMLLTSMQGRLVGRNAKSVSALQTRSEIAFPHQMYWETGVRCPGW